MGHAHRRWTRGCTLGAVVLLLGCGGSGSSGDRTTWALLAWKPDYVAYRADVAAGRPVAELMPTAVDAGWIAGSWGGSASLPPPPTGGTGACPYPAKLDLRAVGRVTPSRVPTYTCGTCWTDASLASLESSLASAAQWDFSESHLQLKYGHEAAACGGGGNYEMATFYMSSWRGPVREADFAPPPAPPVGTGDAPAAVHVQNVYFLPSRQGPLDNCWIKWAVQNLGGVYASISKSPWGPDANLHYYHPKTSTVHAVTIVGWDDDFDRTKFLCTDPSIPVSEQVPAGNGAFIAKDNQGPSMQEAGFFYVSYYDGSIGSSLAAFTAEPLGGYGRIYQYDAAGGYSYLEAGGAVSKDSSWQANVFTAEADERLTAVGLYEPESTMDYQVFVYLDPSNGPLHPFGPVAVADVSLLCGGYYTVPLRRPVILRKGQRFSVVLKGRNRTGDWPAAIRIQRKDVGYSYVTAAPGRGFISMNGVAWTDLTSAVDSGGLTGMPAPLTDASLCIKAFTKPSIVAKAELPSAANGSHFVWEILNEAASLAWARPVAKLYRRLPAGGGFELFGSDVLGETFLDAAGASHVVVDGWVPVGPGETVRVLAAPRATEAADRVGYTFHHREDETKPVMLAEIWRYLDLAPDPLYVTATSPMNGGMVSSPGQSLLTVTFDRPVKLGPGIGGTLITSATETKIVYPSVSGNQLMLVTGTPFLTPASDGQAGTPWTVVLPADAAVDATLGNPLVQPYTWSFTVDTNP